MWLTDASQGKGDLVFEIIKLSGSDICDYGLSAYSNGRCPRVVVDALGKLLIQSLVTVST